LFTLSLVLSLNICSAREIAGVALPEKIHSPDGVQTLVLNGAVEECDAWGWLKCMGLYNKKVECDPLHWS
jgi:hypothetical protein